MINKAILLIILLYLMGCSKDIIVPYCSIALRPKVPTKVEEKSGKIPPRLIVFMHHNLQVYLDAGCD